MALDESSRPIDADGAGRRVPDEGPPGLRTSGSGGAGVRAGCCRTPSAGGARIGAAHPRLVALLAVAIVLVLLIIAGLLDRRQRYVHEIDRLRSAMTDVERERTDALLAEEAHRFEVSLALLRRQAKVDGKLHLAVDVGTRHLVLQREGAVLRSVLVEIGSDAPSASADGDTGAGDSILPPGSIPLSAPRGTRTVERVIPAGQGYTLPSWAVAGRPDLPDGFQLDSGLLLLGGGLLVYASPASGPLAPPEPVLPGSVRVPAEDFEAMRENIVPGMTVYFY